MRKLLLIILLFSSFISFSQELKNIKIDFEGKTDERNQYIKLLKIKDNDALIIKVGHSSYWSKGLHANVIVYMNNGLVKRFEVFEPFDIQKKVKIKRGEIKKHEYQYYWNLLSESSRNGLFEIDKSKLNINKKELDKEGTALSMLISDGVDYYLEIYQGRNFLTYNSYEPKSFIKEKFPGFEERQKLVDIMSVIERLIKSY